MSSKLPKPLQKICGISLLELVLNLAETVSKQSIVVLGHGAEQVQEELSKLGKNTIPVLQKNQLGTANAVSVALPHTKEKNLLVLYADVPLIKKETISNLLEQHLKSDSDVTLLTAFVSNPKGYGRVIRSKNGSIRAIVEETELTETNKNSTNEIFTGVAAYKTDFLRKVIPTLKPDNRKGEYYLTDVVRHTKNLTSVTCGEDESIGINNKAQLVKAESLLERRIQAELIERGAKIVAPNLVYIEYGVEVAGECLIEPFCVIRRGVKIGEGCVVGPFAHLRKGTVLEDHSEIGNFVETKNTLLGRGAKAKHLSYLGDSEIGAETNIGAGTICANFDGKKKHKTVIEEKASIGSGTVLVAPVRIGAGAVTGAGAVVTKGHDVPSGETVVGIPARPLKKRKEKNPR
jgi:bifunctional UDP-N-acetylglucosamine pyrophosphorylase/glucosamine-1-phosphate N-acetyltransferase